MLQRVAGQLGSPSARREPYFDRRSLLAIWLPGLYAWGATVGVPAFARGTPQLARATAGLALIALLAGPPLARFHPSVGRGVGMIAFSLLCAGAWSLLGGSLSAGQLDPLRASLGCVGFGLFALGWGHAPGSTAATATDVETQQLEPYQRPPRGARLAFAVLCLGASSLPALAFRIQSPGVALLGHALALAGAIAVVVVGTAQLGLPTPDLRPPRRARPYRWLLAGWLVLGAALGTRELFWAGGPG